jgi:hypothetical protein
MVLLLLLSYSLVALSGCAKKEDTNTIGSLEGSVAPGEASLGDQVGDGSSDEEIYETDEFGNTIDWTEEPDETTLIEETTREPSEILPEVAIYDKTVLDNYNLEINSSERFIINYPKGYTIKPVDKYKTYLTKEKTQFFVYCINRNFVEPNQIYYSSEVTDSLYRFPYSIDGVKYTASIMDRKAVTYKTIAGKEVSREAPSIEFASTDKTTYVKPICVSYFVPFNDKGFALIAVSTDKTEDELDEVLTNMVSTLNTYTPSRYEAQYDYNGNMFIASDKTGITFPYPEGWTVSSSKNGFVIISSPNDGSLYDGAKIIYKTDKEHQYVEDYAQFAGIPLSIANLYMKPGYEPDMLAADFTVLSMDDSVTVDGVKCYLFQIEDYIKPLTKTAELLLPSTGEKIYSYRYTFNSNGIPTMVSFQYTANNQYQVRDMAEEIMSKITVK